jgi:hypothetical protein
MRIINRNLRRFGGSVFYFGAKPPPCPNEGRPNPTRAGGRRVRIRLSAHSLAG